MKEFERMQRRGGADPWAVEYQSDLSGKDTTDPSEKMAADSASSVFGGGTKSFSF